MTTKTMISKKVKDIFKSSTKRATLVLLLFFVALTVMPTEKISASPQSELNKLNAQIDAATKKLNAKQGESRTLANQVAIFDDQIYKLQLEIDATQKEMNLVNQEIAETNQKIKDTEMDLKAQKATLFEYLRVIYEEGETSTLELIVVSNNFSDFVDKAEYLQVMQMKVNETVEKIKALKLELDKKKGDLITKKVKIEGLKKQQLLQKGNINNQRAAKDKLLAVTKGQENAYKSLTNKLKAEYDRIQAEMWASVSGGSYVSQGTVKAGDVIGTIGNSGYSTGCHLHFEIRQDQYTHKNPQSYLGNGYFYDPAPGVPINVPYGYSSFYFPGVFHTGIDKADGCAGTPVRATAPGEIIVRVTGRPNTYPTSLEYGNYVMIHHTNGMFSLYGHLR